MCRNLTGRENERPFISIICVAKLSLGNKTHKSQKFQDFLCINKVSHCEPPDLGNFNCNCKSGQISIALTMSGNKVLKQ